MDQSSHKLDLRNKDALFDNIKKVLHTTFLFPSIPDDYYLIKDACVNPLRLSEKDAAHEQGERVPKYLPECG